VEKLSHTGGSVKWFSCYENSLVIPKILDTKLPLTQAVLSLNTCPKELKQETQNNICASMFCSSIIHKSQKMETTLCPLMDNWITKM
jgi:hypothetical protein